MNLKQPNFRSIITKYLNLSEEIKTKSFKKTNNPSSLGISEFRFKSNSNFKQYFETFIDFEVKVNCKDFIVREVQKGKPLNILDQNVPIEEIKWNDNKNSKIEKLCFKEKKELESEGIKFLIKNAFLIENDLQKFKKYLSSDDIEKTFIFNIEKSKEKRSNLHKIIKEHFLRYNSHTLLTKEIELFRKAGKLNSLRKIYSPNFFTKNNKPFLHFTLYKENLSSNDVMLYLAAKLKKNKKCFNLCGNKDKKAITTQRISASRVTSERLIRITKHSNNFFVGDFEYNDKPLKIGSLDGNHFEIILRGIKNKKHFDILNKRAKIISKNGFINYFGTQRFGTKNIPTHFLGKLLIQEKYEEFIALVLFPEGKNSKSMNILSYNNFDEAKQYFNKGRNLEKTILNSLSKGKRGKDVFQDIPRPSRSIYVHAYQSYIWNLSVSKRLNVFGSSLVPGDIVKNNFKDETVFVTEKEIENKEYSILDLVLPLPTFDAKLPRNVMEKIIKELLLKDGFKLNDFKKFSRDRTMLIYSQMRKVISKPLNLKTRIIHLNEKIKFPISDFIISNSNLKMAKKEFNKELYQNSINNINEENFQISFILKPSCYATMLLRELRAK